MLKYNFHKCNFDNGLFYKVHRDKDNREHLTTVCTWVDDLRIHSTRECVEEFKANLRDEFGKIVFKDGPKTEYLKCTFEREDDRCYVSQSKAIEEICEGVSKERNSPHTSDLFKHDVDSPLLTNPTEYRSMLMKIAWTTRSRPDIAVTVAALSQRMQNPTLEDMEKLNHLRGFLFRTRHFRLCIKPTRPETCPRTLAEYGVQVFASADAGHATNHDGKSQSGLWMTIGCGDDNPQSWLNAPIEMKSLKQQRVAVNAWEAETDALYYAVCQVRKIRNVLTELGMRPMTPSPIEQDNSAAILLANRGVGTGKNTKHVELRKLSVTESIMDGYVKLVKIASDDVLADGATKPFVGSRDHDWRLRIMNHRNT